MLTRSIHISRGHFYPANTLNRMLIICKNAYLLSIKKKKNRTTWLDNKQKIG